MQKLSFLLTAMLLGCTIAAETVRFETDALTVTGSGWSIQPLGNNKRAFANRDYVWSDLPRATEGWTYTQTAGGEPADITVQARQATTVYMASTVSRPDAAFAGWRLLPGVRFRYTDNGRTPIFVYSRDLKTGEKTVLPQGTWAGGLLLMGMTFDAFERLPYNHPGQTAFLGVGLWAWPLPIDLDGDGDLDLVVSCPDKPYNGLYFFENPAPKGTHEKFPLFKPGRRIGDALNNAQLSIVNGKPVVMSPATRHPHLSVNGTGKPVKIDGVPHNVHVGNVRANQWRMVDYDGDGAHDLIVGVGDWKAYGWDNAYDANGEWVNGPLRGLVYLLRNRGSDSAPDYAPACLVMLDDGHPMEVFGMPSPNFADWDGDGDLDVLCGEFLDGFTYFENIGARHKPRYAAGRRVTCTDGSPLTMDLQMITPVAIDWDSDGHLDLICGDEDGRVALIENSGRLAADRTPLFLPPRYFRQEAQDVKFGALVTPVGCDWDGDGDWDLICGNTAGYIAFIENLSGPSVEHPQWAEPKPLEIDGIPLRIMAGRNGSIQGPCEAKWGYTTQTVADWDGDGLPDIIANSILGKIHWYRNIGTRTEPKLEAAQPIEVEWDDAQPALAWGWMRPEGKALLTQWRTTPVAVDWNQDGLVDLVMLDQQGYLAFFERAIHNGHRVLLPPKRIFCDGQGHALQFNKGAAGRSGRRKLCIVDWDGDGRLDILINSKNAEFWRQTRAEGGRFFFTNMGDLHIRNIEGHDVSPTVVDFDGNGIPDFIGGAEDGYLYYLRNPRAQGE